MKGDIEMKSNIAPGKIVKEYIKDNNLSTIEFANRCYLPVSLIESVINGGARITENIAMRFEHVFSTPRSFWINLEKDYQLTKDTVKV